MTNSSTARIRFRFKSMSTSPPLSLSIRLKQQSENHVIKNIVDETAESTKDDGITQQKPIVTASADQVMKMHELQFGLNLCVINSSYFHNYLSPNNTKYNN